MRDVQQERFRCPDCATEGWYSPSALHVVDPRRDHDRPDGRKCRKAATRTAPTITVPADPPIDQAGFFYVTCRNDSGETRRVRGPWRSHAAALEAVTAVSREAGKLDPRACWYAWGTARAATDLGPGLLGPATEEA